MLTEATMSHDEMEKAVRNGYLCAQCQGLLTVAWSAKENCYVLRCGNDINHQGITRHDKKYEQKLKEGFSMDSNALMTMDEAKMLQRVEMARFPQDLTIADKKLLAQIAITYGFDPLMGEVTIYQGRPFVSIDGRYRKAQETGRLDGVETRPASKREREDWQIPEGDYFFRSEVFVKDASHPFVAWGRVRKAETIGGKGFKPVETNPQRMAEKRAEAQALRKAFHIPMPSVEDIGSPDYDIESTAVDVTTGEITEPETKPEPKLGDMKVVDGVTYRYVKAGKDIKVGPSEPKAEPEPHPKKPQATPSPVVEKTSGNLPEEAVEPAPQTDKVDRDWLNETLLIIHWNEKTCLSWIKAQLKVEGKDLMEVLNSLDRDKLKVFMEHITSMRDSAGV